jgi:hypothetical protein
MAPVTNGVMYFLNLILKENSLYLTFFGLKTDQKEYVGLKIYGSFAVTNNVKGLQ